jgi:hypothetical protein
MQINRLYCLCSLFLLFAWEASLPEKKMLVLLPEPAEVGEELSLLRKVVKGSGYQLDITSSLNILREDSLRH